MIERYEQIFSNTDNGEKGIVLNPNVSLIKVEVIGSGSISVTAMLDRDSNKNLLGAIKANDFSKVTVMSAGLYTIEVSGYYKIFFTSSGNSDVYIKTIC